MSPPNASSFTRALGQGLVIFLLAGAIALGVNHWRGEGIPLVGDWSPEAQFSDASGNSLVIGLDRAVKLYESQGAIFIDARPERLYRQGHIRGALNIPWQDVDRYFAEAMDRLDREKLFITYCDGETCELSHELALFFKEMGFENVRVLVNGWTVWREAGLPMDGGT